MEMSPQLKGKLLMHNSIEKITETLNEIFRSRFDIDLNAINRGFYDKNLLGTEWGLASRDLVYLFFDIEKKWNIAIPEEDILSEKFTTVNNIIDIISGQLAK